MAYNNTITIILFFFLISYGFCGSGTWEGLGRASWLRISHAVAVMVLAAGGVEGWGSWRLAGHLPLSLFV